jgi:hypothetical protein
MLIPRSIVHFYTNGIDTLSCYHGTLYIMELDIHVLFLPMLYTLSCYRGTLYIVVLDSQFLHV